MRRAIPRIVAAIALTLAPARPASGQDAAADRTRILAIADSALAAINRNDMVSLTDLMIEEGMFVPVSTRDGQIRHSVRARAAERARTPRSAITERGFKPDVRISGPMAVVWLPYDLYIDGNWSHCGVDAFTLVKTSGAWKIATLAWSVEQPPACERHPDGPPKG